MTAAGEGGTRAGFVAILGAPNVGKSTLVNRLVGAKVSIVSPKVQTTRSRILGIYMQGRAQVVLIDTPGIFEPKRRLDRAMVAAAWSGMQDADTFALVIDAAAGIEQRSRAILDKLAARGQAGLAVLNKIDAVAKPMLLGLSEQLMKTGCFEDTLMVSAKNGDGVDDLAARLAAGLPEEPWLFPEDEISDMPGRLLAAEITREKLYLNLHQELPYSLAVETDSWEALGDGSARVRQIVYVARDSQKGIVLGKGGAMIRRIGEAARTELSDLLGFKVHLMIQVKVRRKWDDDRAQYTEWGLDYDA